MVVTLHNQWRTLRMAGVGSSPLLAVFDCFLPTPSQFLMYKIVEKLEGIFFLWGFPRGIIFRGTTSLDGKITWETFQTGGIFLGNFLMGFSIKRESFSGFLGGFPERTPSKGGVFCLSHKFQWSISITRKTSIFH